MDYKKTLDEIITLYQLEPSLTDIYVEGILDKGIILWFLNKTSKLHVNVYTIDLIEIPLTTITKYNLNVDSNRSKLIILASELNSQCQKKLISYVLQIEIMKMLSRKTILYQI